MSWLIPCWISDDLDRLPKPWERPIAIAAKLVGADPDYWCNAAWWLTLSQPYRANIIHAAASAILMRRDDGTWPEPRSGLKHACPVCRVPTLDQRGYCEIRPVCWWEDDGIAEPDWVSGPNHRTLAEARRQFADGMLAYDRSETGFAGFGGNDPEVTALKHTILACAASLRLMDDGPAFAACRDLLDEMLAQLEALVQGRLRQEQGET